MTLAQRFDALFAFGDSLTDQGNLYCATAELTGSGIPNSTAYFEGRFANGPVYVERLARRMRIALAPSFRGGSNYAYGGARLASNAVENPPNPKGFAPGAYPWSFELQRRAFASRGIQATLPLVVIWMGANDIADLMPKFFRSGFEATQAASDGVALELSQAIGEFADAGARFFLVLNLPDLGLLPAVRRWNLPGSTLVSDAATRLAACFNTELARTMADLQSRRPVLSLCWFDTFELLRQIVLTPQTFGFSNVRVPCHTGDFLAPASSDGVCADPDRSLFWDEQHPSAKFHQLLAEALIDRMVALSWPVERDAEAVLPGFAGKPED